MRSFGCIFLIASALFALAVVTYRFAYFNRSINKSIFGNTHLFISFNVFQGDPMAAFEKCKKSTNASEADVQSIMSHKPLDTKGACLLACIHSELGIVSKI